MCSTYAGSCQRAASWPSAVNSVRPTRRSCTQMTGWSAPIVPPVYVASSTVARTSTPSTERGFVSKLYHSSAATHGSAGTLTIAWCDGSTMLTVACCTSGWSITYETSIVL